MADRLTVGQVARAAGVSAKAVRLYEERGLLPLAERSEAGYRIFTGQDVETTRFIRRARGLGLGLDVVTTPTWSEWANDARRRRRSAMPCSSGQSASSAPPSPALRTCPRSGQLRGRPARD